MAEAKRFAPEVLAFLGAFFAHVAPGTGPVADGAADIFVVRSAGRIGGAVLDVWYRYPAPGQEDGFRPAGRPFHELDNVIMTPHASAWTEGLMERRWSVIAENIGRLASGEPLLNRIARPA